MSISISLNKFSVFIGQVGEAIVKKYLENNGFTIYAEEYEIPYIGARVDFLISKEDNKTDAFEKIVDSFIHRNLTLHPEWIVAEYKGKKYTHLPYEEFRDFTNKVSEKHPGKSLTYLGDEASVIFYDVRPLAAEHYKQIKENFTIVEVKSSIGKYPRNKGKSGFSKSQIENVYYDSLLRVKIEPNIERGFKGTIHPQDLENFLAHSKNA